MVLLCQCTLLWDRMVGGNPRAFGFPLLVVFLRYAVCNHERGTLIALFLQAICYPSIFVVCAPAYGLTLLVSISQNKPRILRLCAIGLLAVACIPSAWGRVDPRIGSPPTNEQAATLRQMQPGGAQPFFPLPSVQSEIVRSTGATLGPYGRPLWPAAASWNSRLSEAVPWLLFGVLLAAALQGWVVLPPIFSGLWLSSLLMLGAAHLVAYRLFLPERLLTFTWPVLFRVAVLESLRQLLAPRLGRLASIGASLGLCGLLFSLYGDGLLPRYGVHDWSSQDTPLVRHIATLPKDIRLAAQPRLAAFIQTFAQRQVFVSSTTNMLPHGYQYGRTMEQRLEAFFRAYYSPDRETLLRFAAENRIHYMVVDARDFGPDAVARSRYAEPWNRLTAELVLRQPVESLVLAQPAATCVTFRDGPMQLVDLRCMAAPATPAQP